MDRKEWLKKVRTQAEKLYDHGAPAYWVNFGMTIDESHRLFIQKFLGRLKANSSLLDAACGGGRFDGMLMEAGHSVIGIDQSSGVLARAREHYALENYPQLEYIQMGLQEITYRDKFDGIICMDAMEHICPEDWPVILNNFQRALKDGGMLYMTVDAENLEEDRKAYERAKAMGLPVVMGEIVFELDAAYDEAMSMDALELKKLDADRLDHTVYHYHPSTQQVRAWSNETGFVVEEQASGEGYEHFLLRKRG